MTVKVNSVLIFFYIMSLVHNFHQLFLFVINFNSDLKLLLISCFIKIVLFNHVVQTMLIVKGIEIWILTQLVLFNYM